MSIETRGQWIRIGDSWIDSIAVVCVERHDEEARTLVGLSSGACADCEVEADEVIEAVHRARRFVDADLASLPGARRLDGAVRAWVKVLLEDRTQIVDTLRAGAAKAGVNGYALRAAADALAELGA